MDRLDGIKDIEQNEFVRRLTKGRKETGFFEVGPAAEKRDAVLMIAAGTMSADEDTGLDMTGPSQEQNHGRDTDAEDAAPPGNPPQNTRQASTLTLCRHDAASITATPRHCLSYCISFLPS
jgi:hypothetical protein